MRLHPLCVWGLTKAIKSRCRHPQRELPVALFGTQMIEIYELIKVGWGGRDRTCEYRYQKPAPYHLATPHPTRGAI